MSGNGGRGRGSVDRAAERIRRIFGSEAERQRLEQAEVEQLRASGWRPPRPVSMPAPEDGYGVADAGEAIQRQMDHENAYLDEARRRLAQRPQLAQAPAAVLPPIPPRKPADPRWYADEPPLSQVEIRAKDVPDGYGQGTYRADRRKLDGTSYPHPGVDLIAPPGTTVYAPLDGELIRTNPYSKDPSFTGVGIRDKYGRVVKLWYVEPHTGLQFGQQIKAGTYLGKSQSLQNKYKPKQDGSMMTDHVHVQFEEGGRLVDPTPWVTQWQETAGQRAERRRRQLLRIERRFHEDSDDSEIEP